MKHFDRIFQIVYIALMIIMVGVLVWYYTKPDKYLAERERENDLAEDRLAAQERYNELLAEHNELLLQEQHKGGSKLVDLTPARPAAQQESSTARVGKTTKKAEPKATV